MPTPVGWGPSGAELARLGVGKPVSQSHGKRWSEMLAFLNGHNLQTVFSGWFPPQTADTNCNVAYNRSPDCNVLVVRVQLAQSAVADTIAATVALAGATLLHTDGLDGVRSLPATIATRRARTQYTAWLDVSGVTAGTTADLNLSWITTGGTPKGLAYVSVVEVPLADLDPGAPSTELGFVNSAWPSQGNDLSDSDPGVTSTAVGFPRVYQGIDQARAGWRMHRQIVRMENTTDALVQTGTSFAAWLWPQLQSGVSSITHYDPGLTFRARRLYTTAVPEQLTCRYRYRVGAAGDTAVLRCTINGTNFDTGTLNPGDTGWHVATVAVTAATSTANQEVAWALQSKVGGAGQHVYLSQAALLSNES